jgi:RimJ/RimL family protein N-acetyltransferase
VAAPEELSDGSTRLRRFTVDDAPVVAAAVRESMDHLAAWMPWADDKSATVAFQRQRLEDSVKGYGDDRGSWEYAICDRDGNVLGSCGLVVRDDGRLEIGYWVHVDHAGRGHATRAARMLSEVWRAHRSEPRVEIRCDEANTTSAAIPARLGFRYEGVVEGPREAQHETGRTMVWVLER